jgi:hypothetical protein
MQFRRLLSVSLPAFVILTTALQGCQCSSLAKPRPFTTHVGDTMINCRCNVQICYLTDNGTKYTCNDCPSGCVTTSPQTAQDACAQNFPIHACLPPELNLPVEMTQDPAAAAGLADMGEAQFALRVDQYCRGPVTNIVYHMLGTLNGGPTGFCVEKGCVAPDGGIGGNGIDPSTASVFCFADPIVPTADGGVPGPATAPDPSCDVPCGNTVCTFQPDGGNCTFDNVAKGGIHPDKCKCNQIVAGGCDNDDSPVFCAPPPAMGDPPVQTASPLTFLLSKPTVIQIDPAQSSVTLTISAEGENPTHTRPVYGWIDFYGDPCPGAECDMLMDWSLFPADFSGDNKFHLPTGVPDQELLNLASFGGTTTHKAHILADGSGTIALGELNSITRGVQHQDGFDASKGMVVHSFDGTTFESSNTKDIHFKIDFSHGGLFSLGPASLSAGGTVSANGTLTVVGRVTNLPPVARAGTYPVLECTQPGGALVTLDAKDSSDPDGDRLSFAWSRGSTFDPSQGLPRDGAGGTTVLSPLGTTAYSLSVSDAKFVTTFDSTTVTVEDTTPPTLTLSAAPDCLWPPNHKMVLYQLGDSFRADAADVCQADPPSPKIVNVVSNQPPLGAGSGTAAPDVLFGNGAFCIRSERDGTQSNDREYTVTVTACDNHNNCSTKDLVIRVGHDQGQGQCQNVDASRVVTDDDPRCTAATPVVPAPSAPTPETARTGSNSIGQASSCAIGSPGTGPSASTVFIMFGAILVVLARRRWASLVALLLVVSPLSGCTSTAQCLTGWWQDPATDACVCPSQPECSPGDCKAISFLGFTSTTYYSGTISWSAQAQTMSSEGTVTTGTYVITGGNLQLTRNTGDQTAFALTCSGNQMTLNGANKVRASTSLAQALTSATAAGTTWQRTPLSSP